jgi:hypothetical protein
MYLTMDFNTGKSGNPLVPSGDDRTNPQALKPSKIDVGAAKIFPPAE